MCQNRSFFLVKSFLGNFYRHLVIFFWSHWSWTTGSAKRSQKLKTFQCMNSWVVFALNFEHWYATLRPGQCAHTSVVTTLCWALCMISLIYSIFVGWICHSIVKTENWKLIRSKILAKVGQFLKKYFIAFVVSICCYLITAKASKNKEHVVFTPYWCPTLWPIMLFVSVYQRPIHTRHNGLRLTQRTVVCCRKI